MEKDYCNFSDLEPMEKIMYYNSLYMFLSQLNINTPGFAKKYNEMFNSDLTLKAGYEIAICKVDYSIVGVLITVDADESCEPYVLDGYKGIGIEEQLSDMMQRAYARLHQTRTWFPTPTHASNYLQTDGQTSLITKPSASLPDSLRSMTAVSRSPMKDKSKKIFFLHLICKISKKNNAKNFFASKNSAYYNCNIHLITAKSCSTI